jgi:hypothetical protein
MKRRLDHDSTVAAAATVAAALVSVPATMRSALYTGAIVGMLDESHFRVSAMRLLASGRIGMRAPDISLACSAVTNMLTDTEPDMRYWAEKALRKLKRQRARLHWATARVYRVRWYGRFWYEYCEKLCAPGGIWEERDRAAFEEDFI